MRDALLANGVDADALGKAIGMRITVPAAAALYAEVVWQSSWATHVGFASSPGMTLYGSKHDAAAALAGHADMTVAGDVLLAPILTDFRAHPAKAATLWCGERELRREDARWGHQWECGNCSRGRVSCDACHRTGVVKCHQCDHNGRLVCNVCWGSGCHHDGRKTSHCGLCAGKGYLDCFYCYSRCGPGKDRCSRCEGGGTLACRSCAGTGGFTASGSVAFKYCSTAEVVFSTGIPPEAGVLASTPLAALSAVPGANVRVVRIDGSQGRMHAALELEVVVEEAEVPIEGHAHPARAMAATALGFLVHNGFLSRCTLGRLRPVEATIEDAEVILRDARCTRVGAALLRLIADKSLAAGSADTPDEVMFRSVLHANDAWFIGNDDLVPWRNGLRSAYAIVPAEVIRRQWRVALSLLLAFSAVLPLTHLPRLLFDGRGEREVALAVGCAVSLLAAYAARAWVGAAAGRRLRQVVPDATASPSQGRWPVWATAGALCLSLASGTVLYRRSDAPHSSPSSAARVPVGPAMLAVPTSFPGSDVYPIAIPGEVRGDPVLFRAQVVLVHLGLLATSAVDGQESLATRESLMRLVLMAGGSAEAERQVRRLYPNAALPGVQGALLLAKAALLGTLSMNDSGAGNPLRHLPPVIRLRQSSADVARFQNAVEAAVSRLSRPNEEQGAAWSGSMPDSTAWITIETTPELARRDAAGCLGIRLTVKGNGTTMPAQAVRVCPDDLRRR